MSVKHALWFEALKQKNGEYVVPLQTIDDFAATGLIDEVFICAADPWRYRAADGEHCERLRAVVLRCVEHGLITTLVRFHWPTLVRFEPSPSRYADVSWHVERFNGARNLAQLIGCTRWCADIERYSANEGETTGIASILSAGGWLRQQIAGAFGDACDAASRPNYVLPGWNVSSSHIDSLFGVLAAGHGVGRVTVPPSYDISKIDPDLMPMGLVQVRIARIDAPGFAGPHRVAAYNTSRLLLYCSEMAIAYVARAWREALAPDAAMTIEQKIDAWRESLAPEPAMTIEQRMALLEDDRDAIHTKLDEHEARIAALEKQMSNGWTIHQNVASVGLPGQPQPDGGRSWPIKGYVERERAEAEAGE